MKRFWHFDKNGKFTHDNIGADDNITWCWDSNQKYFVKGERGYYVFASNTEPVEYWVACFSTLPEKSHSGRIYPRN
jgi:hypothetical protein